MSKRKATQPKARHPTGHINQRGGIVTCLSYDKIWKFHDGLARVQKGREYGYVDVSGKERISCKFDDDHGFHNGLVLVKEKGSWGYYDKTGKMVTPIIYQDIYLYMFILGGRRRIW